MVKRFLNADSYASTGQGFLGYNMFAYCGNNPIISADPSGCACIVASNHRDYGNGLVEYTDAGTGTPLSFIDNQDDPSVATYRFGLSSIGHSGCGPIAIYNALIMLGDYVPLKQILKYYSDEWWHRQLFFGIAGSLPATTRSFFEERGYRVIVTCTASTDYDYIDAIASVADANILWYMWAAGGSGSIDSFGGHFTAFERTGSKGSLGFTAHNAGSGTATFRRPSEYGTRGSRFVAVVISIFKAG